MPVTLTPAVEKESRPTLEVHELIKIKIPEQEKEARVAIVAKLVDNLDCVLVQRYIGHVVVVYKKRIKTKNPYLSLMENSNDYSTSGARDFNTN